MPDAPIARVVVLGGGSAGWLTAGLLAARLGHRVTVTVIEAPMIAPIGVGEGTWPTMRDTLRAIGVSEADFVRECEAAFKQGSLFVRWGGEGAAEHYLHPFTLPQGYGDAPLVAAWQARHAAVPFAALVGPQPHLCLHGRAPKQATTPEYAAVANYGYHFDAGRLGPFLRGHCTRKLGVTHCADEVVAVRSDEHGDIAALQTRHHGEIAGELFIDCSGMRAQLLAGHFDVGFEPCKDVLFCDSALAVQLPYTEARAPIASQTIATAQPNGWIWDIGLQSRRGVGLVYSSAHGDEDQALQALRDYVAASGGARDLLQPRRLRFEPGFRRRFWHRNCLAIGLAAGFIEPLEASALALVEFSASFLCEQFPATRAMMDTVARRFNDACRYRWGRIIDFLKLHYVLSRRDDSDFWRDHRRAQTVPERLQELLELWRAVPPSRHDFERHDEPFPSASWQYVLYGMGFRPDHAGAEAAASLQRAEACFEDAARLTGRMLAALPSHRELIDHVRQHGMHRI